MNIAISDGPEQAVQAILEDSDDDGEHDLTTILPDKEKGADKGLECPYLLLFIITRHSCRSRDFCQHWRRTSSDSDSSNKGLVTAKRLWRQLQGNIHDNNEPISLVKRWCPKEKEKEDVKIPLLSQNIIKVWVELMNWSIC